jgi:hypothetical protein
MIKEAFAENGIEFAHRNVTVYMPPGEEDNTAAAKAAEAGAAADAIAAASESGHGIGQHHDHRLEVGH